MSSGGGGGGGGGGGSSSTDSPTSSPTTSPTDSPTSSPTDSPTSSPTDSPTSSPTSSPTTSSSSSSSSSSSTTAIIVGSVAGFIAFVVLVQALIWFFRRRLPKPTKVVVHSDGRFESNEMEVILIRLKSIYPDSDIIIEPDFAQALTNPSRCCKPESRVVVALHSWQLSKSQGAEFAHESDPLEWKNVAPNSLYFDGWAILFKARPDPQMLKIKFLILRNGSEEYDGSREDDIWDLAVEEFREQHPNRTDISFAKLRSLGEDELRLALGMAMEENKNEKAPPPVLNLDGPSSVKIGDSQELDEDAELLRDPHGMENVIK
eukprot:TRINITY_DN4243_c0_g1_i1.p1 TRINITY_DN4243_c0_g1~~TRINITY_DN4243_c0_g1_i1.p1  ORF type:complete len:328 (-),score=66.93 TRINITY_DN4243_c0_g1_i1:20-976(-)